MAEEEVQKEGLQHLSDDVLATIVEEYVNANGGNLKDEAEAAFMELQRRTPE